MHRLTRFIVAHPRATVALWVLVLAIAAPFALRLRRVAQGGSEAIRGTESHAVMTTIGNVLSISLIFGMAAKPSCPEVVSRA